MRTIETISELRHQVAAARGRGERVGFVPSMGALHDGHAVLIRVAHAQCDLVIVSAYVNPLQFGPNEDFDKYPRTPEHDELVAGNAGADLLWRPDREELSPAGSTITIDPGPLGRVLCGDERPGHFTGVATIVARLVGAVRPDAMYLGEKDWQQLVIIQRLVDELFLAVEVRAVTTVRDVDGLAISSRNAYLSPEQRDAALAIPKALAAASEAAANGERSVGRLRARVEVTLAAASELNVGYVEIVDAATLEPLDVLDRTARLLVSAHIGETRLIDNIGLEAVPVGMAISTHKDEAASRRKVHTDQLLSRQPTSSTRGPWQ